MEIIIYGIVCLFSTTIGAISGIGGGVIIKPALDMMGTLTPAAAAFLSSSTVFAMSAVSVLRSRRDTVKVEPKKVTPLAIGAAVGGVMGKWLLDLVKNSGFGYIGVVQNLIIVLLILSVFIYLIFQKRIKTLSLSGVLPCLLIGLLLGTKGAFLGIGGGPINLVVLYFFFSMNNKSAVINSIYIILFSQAASLITTFITGTVPVIDPLILCLAIACGIAGGFLGRRISKSLTEKSSSQLFSCVLILIILICLYNIIRALL